MPDNRTNTATDPAPQALRLTGAGPAGALMTARPAPVAVSVLQVKEPAVPGTTAAPDRGAIPFEARAAMVSGGTQPAIRTCLVGARIPGAAIYRLR